MPTALPRHQLTWSSTFPAMPAQVSNARRLLADILVRDQRADDALICLSELATNAITHSLSRQPGGCFTVRAQVDDQCLRVEVSDQGGSWYSATPADTEENGRGLLIVGELASRWGCGGHSQHGWTVWFEIEIHSTDEAHR